MRWEPERQQTWGNWRTWGPSEIVQRVAAGIATSPRRRSQMLIGESHWESALWVRKWGKWETDGASRLRRWLLWTEQRKVIGSFIDNCCTVFQESGHTCDGNERHESRAERDGIGKGSDRWLCWRKSQPYRSHHDRKIDVHRKPNAVGNDVPIALKRMVGEAMRAQRSIREYETSSRWVHSSLNMAQRQLMRRHVLRTTLAKLNAAFPVDVVHLPHLEKIHCS